MSWRASISGRLEFARQLWSKVQPWAMGILWGFVVYMSLSQLRLMRLAAEAERGERVVATYRRAPQDIAEVEYIVELIDADIKANLLTWAQAVENRKIHDRISTQKRWHEIRDSLTAGSLKTGHETAQPNPGESGAFDGAPAKEVPSNKIQARR